MLVQILGGSMASLALGLVGARLAALMAGSQETTWLRWLLALLLAIISAVLLAEPFLVAGAVLTAGAALVTALMCGAAVVAWVMNEVRP